MTLPEALSFMHINLPTTLTDLETTYRSLIKQYHPDRNQDRLQWSHEMTLRLNEAYTLIRDVLTKNTVEAEETEEEPNTPSPIYTELQKAWQKIENGIHLFYTYGLENPHIRQEGPFHIKFILAQKQIKQGKKILELYEQKPLLPEDREELSLQKSFCEAFLQNMRIQKTFVADGSIHHKAYKHYYNGSRLLDGFLKKILFPEDYSNLILPPKCSTLCQQELLTVLLHYHQSTWVGEATIKLALLESFLNLMNFRKERDSSHRSFFYRF
ncbi:MAG: J domain-containing protein [Spirochaetes bacterium]|nr:J domain-containing protein [Spirochaetota bacterium]